jgi:ThiF family
MTTLVLAAELEQQLLDLAMLEVETAAVLLAKPVGTGNDMRLLARELILVPEECYERRETHELLVRSDGYVPALARAEETATLPIWLHTHPGDGASTRASRRDRVVDDQISELFRLRAGSQYYGALIVGHKDRAVTFTGHLESTENERHLLDRLLTVGPRLNLTWAADSSSVALPQIFDRNIRAFGGDVQRILGDLKIMIVGCGGTGSAVAEQLVRLGVRHLILVDPDQLSESNVTRVYGSTPGQLGQPKAQILANHLQAIAPDLSVVVEVSKITVEATARLMTSADVAFGCTDDNAGRLILSRAATYLLLPVIDCGVLLSSDADNRLIGIDGRVTLMYPGAACLVCRNRVDVARAGTEMLSPAERIQRIDEGYAPALPGVEPAVVTYTTLVAAYAVSELIERFTRYGPEPPPGEVLIRAHEREVSTNLQNPNPGHYCDPAGNKLGLGDTEPFLEQTWSAA